MEYSNDDRKPMPPQSQSWSEYIKQNKVLIIVILIIIAVAIWYFCFRKTEPTTGAASGVGTGSAPNKISVTRVRGYNNY